MSKKLDHVGGMHQPIEPGPGENGRTDQRRAAAEGFEERFVAEEAKGRSDNKDFKPENDDGGGMRSFLDSAQRLRDAAIPTLMLRGKVDELSRKIVAKQEQLKGVSKEVAAFDKSDPKGLVQLQERVADVVSKLRKLTEERTRCARLIVDRLLRHEGKHRARIEVADQELKYNEAERASYVEGIAAYNRGVDELIAQLPKPGPARALDLTLNGPEIQKILGIFVDELQRLDKQIIKDTKKVDSAVAECDSWAALEGGYEAIENLKTIAGNKKRPKVKKHKKRDFPQGE